MSSEQKPVSREQSEGKMMSSEQKPVSGEQREARSKKPHRNLLAWQKAMDLALSVYQITGNFPKEEIYGLTSQLRRAAVSVPSNIAEGAADRTKQQFSNFLSNAIGSLNEMDTQLELALRLAYLSRAAYDRIFKLLDECMALTYGLRKKVSSKP